MSSLGNIIKKYKLDGETLDIIQMYNQPKKNLGGFFDAVSSMVEKGAKSLVNSLVDKNQQNVQIAQQANKMMQYGINAYTQPPQASSISTLLQSALPSLLSSAGLGNLTQLLPILVSMIQGGGGLSGGKSSSMGYVNPFWIIDRKLKENNITTNGLMRGLKGNCCSLLGKSRRKRLGNGEDILTIPVDAVHIDVPYYRALESILNNPKTQMSMIRFQIIRDPEEAVDRTINVQKAISKIREGVAPQNVLSLVRGKLYRPKPLGASLAESLASRVTPAMSIATSTLTPTQTSIAMPSNILSQPTETEEDIFDEAKEDIKKGLRYLRDTPNITGEDWDNTNRQLWISNLIDTINNAADWDTIDNGYRTYTEKEKYDSIHRQVSTVIENARTKYKDSLKKLEQQQAQAQTFAQQSYLTQQQSAAQQLAAQQAQQAELARIKAEKESSGAAQIDSAINMIEKSVDSVARMASMVDELTAAKGEQVIDDVRAIDDLQANRAAIQQQATLQQKEPQALSKVVQASALNSLKRNAMENVGTLAKKLSDSKLSSIQQQASMIVKENEKLRNELDDRNKEYNDTLNNYRNAQLEQNKQLIDYLQREKDKLFQKLIKSYGILDTMKNKLHEFRLALKETLSKTDSSSDRYRYLATIDKDFAEKLALIDSLGIPEASPEAVDKIYSLFTESLVNNPVYQKAMDTQTKTVEDAINSDLRIDKLPDRPTLIPRPGLQGNSYGKYGKKTYRGSGGMRYVPNPPSATPEQYKLKGYVGSVLGAVVDIAKNARYKRRGLFGGKSLGETDILKSSEFPNLQAVAKLIVAGKLLELTKDIIIDDTTRGSFVNILSVFTKRYRELEQMLSPLVENYLQGYTNNNNDILVDMFDIVTTTNMLDKYIDEIGIFIKKLCWLGYGTKKRRIS